MTPPSEKEKGRAKGRWAESGQGAGEMSKWSLTTFAKDDGGGEAEAHFLLEREANIPLQIADATHAHLSPPHSSSRWGLRTLQI